MITENKTGIGDVMSQNLLLGRHFTTDWRGANRWNGIEKERMEKGNKRKKERKKDGTLCERE